MKRTLFAVCLAVVLLLAGCGSGNVSASGMTASSAGDSEWVLDSGGGYWGMTEDESFSPEAPDTPMERLLYQSSDVKLIRRAELAVQTEQFDQSAEALTQLTAACGGYFESASVYGGSLRDVNASRRGDYIVRVPAEQYERFLESTGDLGYVTSKYESSDNVGEQYYDTEARLKTQRTKQERLLSLLERAETMEDIILLESALSDVEYQIEQYSSTLNRYDALIGYSTITVSLSEVGRITQEVGENASLGQRMAAGVQSSVRSLGKGAQELLVWISYNLFLVIVLAAAAAAAVVAGRRELKRLKQEKKISQTPQAETKPKAP